LQSIPFERWEQDRPAIPQRSRFYPLEPCGVGGPLVESLSSYIVRLAEAHAVSVGDFVLRELSQVVFPGLSRAEGCQPPARIGNLINGFGQCARSCVQGLRTLTLRGDLHHMTLLPFHDFLAPLLLFRRTRAWCPACYDSMSASNSVVYEPLLWSLRFAETCPIHRQRLAVNCPNCRSTLTPLAAFSAPGHCHKCGLWLGGVAGDSAIAAGNASEYQLWTSQVLGEILGASRQLKPETLKEVFWRNIARLVDDLADGNSAAFARTIGCPTSRIGDWVAAKYPPRIDSLIEVSFVLRIPILTLLRDVPEDHRRTARTAVMAFSGRVESARDDSQKVFKRRLREALDEQPAHSSAEICRKSNCTRSTLRRADAELFQSIAARCAAVQRQRRSNGETLERICDLRTIEKLLCESLNLERAISSNQIANHLGYQNAGYIWNKFPELCRAIREKRELDRKARIREIVSTVSDAIGQDPPPSVLAVARRLGFTNTWALWKHAREGCNELIARQKSHEDAAWERIREQIRAVLNEIPPSSVQAVLRRGGVFRALNHRRCADLRAAIASRYRDYMRQKANTRETTIRDEVSDVAIRLCETGVYPSGSRVQRLLSPSSRKRFVAVHTALREILQSMPPASCAVDQS
jgi:TniQ